MHACLEYCPLLLASFSCNGFCLLRKHHNRALWIILKAPKLLSIAEARTVLNVHAIHNDHNVKSKKLSTGLLSLLNVYNYRSRIANLRNTYKLVIPTISTKDGQHLLYVQPSST